MIINLKKADGSPIDELNTESALKFIQEIAKENNVLDKVKIVLYGKKP